MNDIYSAANIARSRARVKSIRSQVANGQLPDSWLVTADEIDNYANDREKAAQWTPADQAEATCPECGMAVNVRETQYGCDRPGGCGWLQPRTVYLVPVDPAEATNCETCQ